jgi:Rha family phage regulatory protein
MSQDANILNGTSHVKDDLFANTEDITPKLPDVFITDNTVMTSSVAVAYYFNKRHDNIVRDIRSILAESPALKIEGASYTDKQGSSRPMYIMDQDAFTLLAMGFTGKKALHFKLAYIKAFNEMKAKLQTPQPQSAPTLPSDYISALEALLTSEKQKAELGKSLEHKNSILLDFAEKVPPKKMRQAINEMVRSYAYESAVGFPVIWNKLYKEFKYIHSIDLKVRSKHDEDLSPIDFAEKLGQLENLYNLAIKMFEI